MASYILSSGERIVRRLHQSKRALLPIAFVACLAAVLPWVYMSGYQKPAVVSLAMKLWTFGCFFWLLLHSSRFFFERYLVTNRRLIAIIHKSPTERLVEETPLERILNISLERKGLLDLSLGLGTVLVHAVGLDEPIYLRHIAGANLVVRFLWQENQRLLDMSKQQGGGLSEGLLQTKKEQYL